MGLHRRAPHVGVGAEDAAVTLAGLEALAAPGAAVEVLASVLRHRLACLRAAQRAGDDRFPDGHPLSVGAWPNEAAFKPTHYRSPLIGRPPGLRR